MTNTLDGMTLRRWAADCAKRAQSGIAIDERDRLLKMEATLLDLAQTQDWLDGQLVEPQQRTASAN